MGEQGRAQMDDLIFLDIETLPDLWLLYPSNQDRLDEVVRAGVPARYKKPESIAKWMEVHSGEVLGRGALDRFRGLTHVVGWALGEDPDEEARVEVETYRDLFEAEAPEEAYREREARFLEKFQDTLPERVVYRKWVSWGGNHFDLPWLALRALRYRMPRLGMAIPTDKWGAKSIDLMERAKFTDYRGKFITAEQFHTFVDGVAPSEDPVTVLRLTRALLEAYLAGEPGAAVTGRRAEPPPAPAPARGDGRGRPRPWRFLPGAFSISCRRPVPRRATDGPWRAPSPRRGSRARGGAR